MASVLCVGRLFPCIAVRLGYVTIVYQNQREMPLFKNNETGEIKKFGRTRTYIYDNGTKKEVCLQTGEILTGTWTFMEEETDYSSVAAKKASNDGFGTR